ncbi:MAG: hypothetical protein MUC73_13860 [Cyclobacteriaceae bacterium]|nr:hypothetical protein [Cyclobacteriaceae bacterium]
MKRILAGFVLIAFIVAGYFFIERLNSKKSISVWDLIPEQALAVYEAGDCDSCQAEASGFLSMLFQANANKETLEPGDSVLHSLIKLIRPFPGSFASLHLTRKDNFSLIHYVSDNQLKMLGLSTEAIKRIESVSGKREYQGISINEYSITNRSYYWVRLENYWALSESPILIEDVIRAYKAGKKSLFKNFTNESQLGPVVRNDAGNLYLNFNGLNSWLGMFIGKSAGLETIANISALDIKAEKSQLIANGFSIIDAANPGILSLFQDQQPVPFSFKRLVSNRSIYVIAYGITDGINLKSKFEQYAFNDSTNIKSLPEADDLLRSLGGEIVICVLESRIKKPTRILIIETNNPAPWNQLFSSYVNRPEIRDSLYSEEYSGYEIRRIENPEFPGKVLYPLIKGFKNSFYTWSGNNLIVAERVDELRAFLNDIETEEVWGKSVSANQFLESTLLESNLSLFINMPQAINFILPELVPVWKEKYTDYQKSSPNRFGWGAFQFSNLNGNFYTYATLTQEANVSVAGSSIPQSGQVATQLESGLYGRPFLVRNHTTKRFEYAVQDSLNTLYSIGEDSQVQWRRKLDGPVVSDIFQIDYLANSKLQLLVLTDKNLYLLDRLGKDVKPYPITHPAQGAAFINVIDYDNSKRYRYLLADKNGKIWMTDKEGKLLDGWKPKNVEGSLLRAPAHYRIAGKDYILAIRRDGKVYLLNRRGDEVPGFPLTINERLEGGYYLEEGNSISNSTITVVSRTGERITFNFQGKIINREALVKASVDDQYSLIPERNNKSYIVKRHNARQLALLNNEGAVILNNGYIGNHPHEVQYYDFGAGKSYVVITDLEDQLTYIYDSNGALLTPIPIEASGVTLKVEREKLHVITTNGKRFSVTIL